MDSPSGDEIRLYQRAFADWLACAVAGSRDEVLPSSVLRTGNDDQSLALALGIAGHVLDYDDTYPDGLVHVSAVVAPAALAIGAARACRMVEVLAGYRRGFEAMASLATGSHPSLYERGWHPTAVCGPWGAALAAATVLGLDSTQAQDAMRLALLGSGGLRSAFGTDGKSIQVGMAAARGVAAAKLAGQGASMDDRVITDELAGFEAVYGAQFPRRLTERVIDRNWIKAYPCCLQTHAAIEAAADAKRRGATLTDQVIVAVHPLSLMAASIREPTNELEAKFSIPYVVASTFVAGIPTLSTFSALDPTIVEASRRVTVVENHEIHQSAARISWGSGRAEQHATVIAPAGSPDNPMTADVHAQKFRSLDAAIVPQLVASDMTAGEVLGSLGLLP